MNTVVDMHFHLDFAAEPAALLGELGFRGVGLLAVSCDVPGYLRAREATACARVDNHEAEASSRAALGLHPWWVARGTVDKTMLSEFERLAPEAEAFGELGLDFNDRHTTPESHTLQLEVFERSCAAASASARAAGIRKPLSIHSVAAADEVLDIFERTGCLDYCACIFHWFSGSLPQLERAREAGCWFSLNEMGLRTGKGREYAKLIPADKLLLETDMPPESAPATTRDAGDTSGTAGTAVSPTSASSDAVANLANIVVSSLEHALDLLAQARCADAESIRELTTANARRLLEHSA